MRVLLLICLLQSSLVFAEKKGSAKDLSLLGKIDEESLNKVETSKKVVTNGNSSSSRFSVSCKDSSGSEFKKGDAGYESCLSGIKAQHDVNKLNSGLNKKNEKDGNSASVNFKIGD